MKAHIVGLLLPFVIGCGSDFEPGSRIDSLRVLAVQSTEPIAHPGEQVSFQALHYDPDAATRPLTWAWAACVNPSSATVDGCLMKIAADTAQGTATPPVVGQDLTTYSLTIPDDALSSLPESARPAALVGILNVACPGTLDLARPSSETGLPFSCTDGTRELGLDEAVVGISRVFVRDRDRNANPVIERVTFDGADWPGTEIKDVGWCDTDGNTYDDCSSNRHRIGAWLSAASFESGTTEYGNAFEEQLIVSYYATEGIFKDEVRVAGAPETGWVARRTASGRVLTFWMVARDDRGGVSWVTRQVRVR